MSVMTQEALLGKMIPSVYIDGVTLESSGEAPEQDDPHIDTGAGYAIQENKFKGSIGTENTLRCVVDISIKEILDSDLIGRWFDDQKISKYIKLMVVQSTESIVTRALSDNTTAISLVHGDAQWDMNGKAEGFLAKGWKSTDPLFLKRKLDASIQKRYLDINHDVLGDSSDLTQKRSSVDQDGNSVVDINFRATFVVPHENPRHVAYFAVAYLDMATLMQDYDIRANEYSLKFQNGKVASEVVIDDWKTVATAIAFFDIDGNQWAGPVHETERGNWNSGARGSADSIPLSMRKVPNSKVHDFRNIKEIKKLRVNLDVVEQELRPVANSLSATNSDVTIRPKKNVYFSDLYLSRDRWGRAKLAFSMDYYKMVKESSVYNRIFEQASPVQREQILNSSRIKSMKFKRRRIKKVNSINNLGNPVGSEVLFDREEPSVVLAYTGENRSGTLKSAQNRNLGGLREIHPALDNRQQGIRFFTAEDRSMYYVTDGHYQYGFEITIEDGTQKFLESTMKNLIAHRKMLMGYYNLASQVGMTKYVVELADPHIDVSWERSKVIKTSIGNYEPVSNRFTKRFIESQRAKWSGKEQFSPWSKPIYVYLNALDMLTPAAEMIGIKNAVYELTKMVRPESGNPMGIMTLVDLMDSLIVRIGNMIGTRDLTSDPRVSKSSKKTSKLPTKTRTIEYWFTDDDHDSNVAKNRGYDYLAVESGAKKWANILSNISNPGLRILSAEKYRKRVEYEITRYYNQISTDLNMKIGTNIVTSGDVMENTSWGFLAPSVCYLAENNISSFVQSAAGTTSDIYDDDYYSSVAGNILYANSSQAPVFPPDVDPEDSALGRDAQMFRFSVGSFLSGLNLSLFDANSSDTLPLTDVPYLASFVDIPTFCPTFKDSEGNEVSTLPDDSSIDRITEKTNDKNYNNAKDAKNLNPNTFYLSLMNSYLRDAGKNHTIRVGASEVDTATVSIWNLNNSSNVINWMAQSPEYLNTVVQSCGKTYSPSMSVSDVVKMLPIHFKSLLLSSVNSGATKRNMHNLGYEARFSVQTNSYYEFNYNLINRIDYLAGYQVTEGMRCKNPIWKPLSFAKWDSSVGEYLLCRQKPFECSSLGVSLPKKLKMPVYDKYFILVPKTNVKPPSTSASGILDSFGDWSGFVGGLENAVIGTDTGLTTTNLVGDESSSLTFCPPLGAKLRSMT